MSRWRWHSDHQRDGFLRPCYCSGASGTGVCGVVSVVGGAAVGEEGSVVVEEFPEAGYASTGLAGSTGAGGDSGTAEPVSPVGAVVVGGVVVVEVFSVPAAGAGAEEVVPVSELVLAGTDD